CRSDTPRCARRQSNDRGDAPLGGDMSQAGAEADAKAVAEANEEFYAAFEALDMDRMEACWRHDDEVRCIHPAWDVMAGWPRVRRSWAVIFANSAYIQFFLTDIG